MATLSVSDQVLAEDGRLIIAEATVAEAGWLVIHAQRDGQVGEVLGYAPLSAGSQQDVIVVVEPLQASPTLIAMLHQDANNRGKFEFPGPDEPLAADVGVTMASFAVQLSFTAPSIAVADQQVATDGLVTVRSVYSPEPGWLFIHADDAGRVGDPLGFSQVKAGLNEDLSLTIDWRQGTPTLYAVLYEDEGRPNRLDEAEDLPLLVGGEPVVTPFNVVLPMDVLVLDQPVVDGQIVIERVVSYGPSWLVVYADEEGSAGRIIGFAPLADGVNEAIDVPLVVSAVTPILHILLHEDTVAGDEFDFPAADGPIRIDNRLPTPFPFRTDSGNYIITRDQRLQPSGATITGTVSVPFVVVDVPSWVLILNGIEEEEGLVLGMARLTPGVHREVRVQIALEAITETLYASLHVDAGDPEVYEYPEGADVPLRRGRSVIQSPFLLLPEEES